MIHRRLLLSSGTAFAVAALAVPSLLARRSRAATSYAVTHTDAEWHKLLTPAQYDILRDSGTEAPFTSPLLQQEGRGVFTCAGCANDLFASATKFDSGTGWPSFFAPLPHAVDEASDSSLMMERTEIHCHRCGGHLGHVFDDGPKPTGLRYCMNGAAMGFRATTA